MSYRFSCKPMLLIALSLLLVSCTYTATKGPLVHSGPLAAPTEMPGPAKMPASAAPTQGLDQHEEYWPTAGWKASTPESQGLDASILEKTNEKILSLPPDIHCVLVIRNGTIVYEKYYQDFNKDKLNNIKSCTKSVMSTLVGLAIKENFLSGTQQKLTEVYPEAFTGDIEPQKKEISIEHLLTMTAGLQWVEGNDSWPWTTSGAPDKYVTDMPMVSKPGEVWNYSSGSAHLLSGVITQASKMSTLDFAKKYLFQPLGITNVSWDKMDGGNYCGAGDLYLTPRDAAKIGYLYLKEGRWEGKQLLPKTWIQASVTQQNEGYPPKGAYGYLWWIKEFGGRETYFASGYGGQHIFVIPDLEMVIVTTASWDKPSSNIAYELVGNYIIPSVLK